MSDPTSSPESRNDLGIAPGDTIGGRYEIVRLLGAGGMGAVFIARHTAIGREVAVKVLRPEVARDPQLSERFLHEARAANEVRHKNIVRIEDFGVDEGRHYMVMELLRGESLATMMTREAPLQPAQIIPILEPVLRALAFAHERGVIHRDIKPDNIFLSQEDGDDHVVPKVLDFGIAKRTVTENVRLTKTNSGLGTPAYMAPEQVIAARDVKASADQYAIGVILYEALAGRRPHRGEDYNSLIIAKVATPAPPLAEVHPELNPGLADVIMQALSISPGQRFPSALALLEALQPYRAINDSPAPPITKAESTGPNAALKLAELAAGTAGTRSPTPALDATQPARVSMLTPVKTGETGARMSGPGSTREIRASTTGSTESKSIVRDPASTTGSPALTTATRTPEAWVRSAAEGAGLTTGQVPPQRSKTPWAYALVVTAALAGGGYYALRPDRAAVPSAEGTRSGQAPSERVVFRIHAEPAETEISIDGDVVGRGIAEIRRPRGRTQYALRLSAPGFVTIEETLSAELSARIDRSLRPVAGANPTAAADAGAPTTAATTGVTPGGEGAATGATTATTGGETQSPQGAGPAGPTGTGGGRRPPIRRPGNGGHSGHSGEIDRESPF